MTAELLTSAFFADRLKVQLREQGARHDLVDAVFALEGQDDLLLIVRRVEALGKFLDTDDGKNLLAGYQARGQHPAHRGEEGQAATIPARPIRSSTAGRREGACRGHRRRQSRSRRAVANEDFAAAMRAMAKLRAACRCLLRQGDGQRRRQGAARKPPASCSTKSAPPPARSPISPRSRDRSPVTIGRAGHAEHPADLQDRPTARRSARSCDPNCRRVDQPNVVSASTVSPDPIYHTARGQIMVITAAHITPLVALVAGIADSDCAAAAELHRRDLSHFRSDRSASTACTRAATGPRARAELTPALPDRRWNLR